MRSWARFSHILMVIQENHASFSSEIMLSRMVSGTLLLIINNKYMITYLHYIIWYITRIKNYTTLSFIIHQMTGNSWFENNVEYIKSYKFKSSQYKGVNPVKHLRCNFFMKIVNDLRPSTIFAKNFILDILQGFE